MAEIRINATGGVKLYDADDSHYAQIVAGTITSNVDALTLGHASADFNIPVKVLGTTPTLTVGDAGAEDTKIVFDGNAKDFYVALDDSADKLVIGEGSTVGTNSILTITDDSLTIGDAAAVDTKIVFDGNAQDYYIGLDDSADDLVIGLGSTVGTTAHIITDEAGHVTMPLQSCFQARGGTQNNMAASSNVTIQNSVEIFDLNSDYNTGTYTFTAPVTGKYSLNASIRMGAVDTAATEMYIQITTSNRNTTVAAIDPRLYAQDGFVIAGGSVVADMDAADTAYVNFYQEGGSAQVDSDGNSFFSGCLLA